MEKCNPSYLKDCTLALLSSGHGFHVQWLPDVLLAKEYMDEVTQPPSPLLLQACAVSNMALATWTAAANFLPH